jgi:hypothetical protein
VAWLENTAESALAPIVSKLLADERDRDPWAYPGHHVFAEKPVIAFNVLVAVVKKTKEGRDWYDIF